MFGSALENYIAQREQVLSQSTIREYKRAQKNYNDICNIPVSDITQDIIQRHINEFTKNHSAKSVRDNHALISAVLRAYRPDFALNTTLPQKQRPELYIPSNEDIKSIMWTAQNTEMEIPILLAAFGPMRRGEICALQYEDIQGKRVHVCRNMVINEYNQYIVKSPKSYAGDRYIDFPEFVIQSLGTGTGRITALNPNMITSRFYHVLKKSNVPHFRFHDLRHYCASILHAIGTPDAYIMERGGWGNDGTLKNVYRHALEDQKIKMTDKANKYFNDMQHEMQHKK